MVRAAACGMNRSIPVHADVLRLFLRVVVGHDQAIVLTLVVVGAGLAAPLHVHTCSVFTLAQNAAGIVLGVLVHRARVFVLHAIQQRSVLVAGAHARGPLRLRVHAQVVVPTAVVLVVITSHEAIVQFGRAAGAIP